jgi:hypothetical protein
VVVLDERLLHQLRERHPLQTVLTVQSEDHMPSCLASQR